MKMAANCPLMFFLCLAGALLTAGAAVKNDHGCPEGWTPFGTRCFKFFDSHLTWTEAEKSCQSLGANLASIHSAEEHAFTSDLIKETTGEKWQTWIGGQDAVQENLWMWSDGSVWNYSSWDQEEPNNEGGNEHFAVIYWGEAVWIDVPENEVRDYICAKDAPPKTEPEMNMGGFLYECTPDMQ